MEEKHGDCGSSFTSVTSLEKQGVSSIPQRYVLPPSQRPNVNIPISTSDHPIIDLYTLKEPSLRSQTINQIRSACKDNGFFQVINHGIEQSVMSGALKVAAEFFNLPNDEKMHFYSDDVHKHKEVNEGSQVLAVNCYPACPEPELTLGIHPHSDYGSITLLLQTRTGLEINDRNNNWVPVPFVEGALVVQLGDQMEVLSNGQYKSVVHRAIVNEDEKRFSIVSLHSFAMDKKMGPALELVDEQHPRIYKEFSFREFLDFISSNDVAKGRFLDTLKMGP